MTHLFRYITRADLDTYRWHGWQCNFYGWRGDDLECFVACFRCCCNRT